MYIRESSRIESPVASGYLPLEHIMLGKDVLNLTNRILGTSNKTLSSKICMANIVISAEFLYGMC